MRERATGWNDEWNDLPEDMRRFATRLARILHELSPRAEGQFVQRNCGVFTESLAEGQLFGHVKGAYTGASDAKPGLVEAAAGGTLFLDEFGALPHAIQAMFLVFLETGEFSRLGSTTVRRAKARIIAATNRNLGAAVAEGKFREDLVARMTFYYEVPPLRERRREIAGIVDRCLRSNAVRHELTADAMSRLRSHEWPGNIRQLLHVLRYCMVFAEGGVIGADLVEEGIRNRRTVMEPNSEEVAERPKPKSDEEKKRELVEVLEATGGNKSEAARVLKIHRRTIYRRLERYGMTPLNSAGELVPRRVPLTVAATWRHRFCHTSHAGPLGMEARDSEDM